MIEPETISEKLMFSTVRLQTNNWTWTWFFFNFKVKENNEEKDCPVIITNKHVINYNESEEVKFSLHTKSQDWNIELQNVIFNTKWFFHQDENIDLCFCFIKPLFEELKNTRNKDIFYFPLDENIIYNNESLESLDAIEDVIMVWYPNWLYDEKNNLPIFRKWITWFHPAINFNGEKIWLVDMACFPGSSWSPIFIYNKSWYTDKRWTLNIGPDRLIFLWVLFSWPQYNSDWEIIVESIPTQQKIITKTPVMINLWYYIKSNIIFDFKSKIERLLEMEKS